MTRQTERDSGAPTVGHRFGPAVTRGVFGQVRASQAVVLVTGLAGALASLFALPVWAGPAAIAPLIAALLVAFLPVRSGEVLLDAARLALGHALGRMNGAASWRSGAPQDGREHDQLTVPRHWGAWRVIGVPHGDREVGVLLDAREGTASATLVVRAEAFALLDAAEQERRFDAWASVLAALARDQRPIRRVAWQERTLEAETDEIAAWFATRRDPSQSLAAPALVSYAELVEQGSRAAIEHECLLSVEISRHARRAEIKNRHSIEIDAELAAGLVVVDELALIAQALVEAGAGFVAALPPNLLASAMRYTTDPSARSQLSRRAALTGEDGCAPSAAGPLALDDAWTHVRSEGAFHAVFWIARWPLRDVNALFLAPLLARGLARRTISVVLEPVAPARAFREAEAAVVGEEGDAQSRSRQGFLETARQRRRGQAAREREAELSDGHAMCRFAGYITVHAETRRELEQSCGEVAQQAQSAHLELRRLNGQHAQALAYAVPGSCRGLA